MLFGGIKKLCIIEHYHIRAIIVNEFDVLAKVKVAAAVVGYFYGYQFYIAVGFAFGVPAGKQIIFIIYINRLSLLPDT